MRSTSKRGKASPHLVIKRLNYHILLLVIESISSVLIPAYVPIVEKRKDISYACDIYEDLLPEAPPCDDYAKYNFVEELLSSIPSSGPVRPVCREKRDPITGRMMIDCRR